MKNILSILSIFLFASSLFSQCDFINIEETPIGECGISENPVQVAIILGDSRGEGLGDATLYNENPPIAIFKHEDYSLEMYQVGKKYLLATAGPTDYHGLELPLGLKIAEQNNGNTVFFFKLVRSGRAVCSDIVNSPDDWNITQTSPADLHALFLERYPVFIEKINQISSCVEIHSVTIFLGANDATHIDCINSHYDNMSDLLQSVNSITGVPFEKMYIPQINGFQGNHTAIKNTHQQLSDDLGIKVVPTDPTHFPDGVHDNSDGYENIAEFIMAQ